MRRTRRLALTSASPGFVFLERKKKAGHACHAYAAGGAGALRVSTRPPH